MQNQLGKKILVIFLIGFILMVPVFAGSTRGAAAATFTQELLYGAVAFSYISWQLNDLNDKRQADMLKQTQSKTGVYKDEQANGYVHNIADRLMSNGLIKDHYEVYITPAKEFNAFCTLGRVIAVNKGTVDLLDEDELASVLGHEMSHGEHKDPVEGTKKILGLSLVVDLYTQNNPNRTSEVLGVVAGNYVANEVITMKEEWNADNSGFNNAVAAGFNPGGPAASMVKLRAQAGELWHEGLSKVINPNNHPKTSDRINNFAKRLTDYSKGHITVKNDQTVQIDNQDVVTPVKTNRYLAEERAYLIAGNLAKLYHNNSLNTAYVGDDGAVYIDGQLIMTPVDNDVAGYELADRINAITGK
ncbi:MAG TPA: M48 family metalloprotease [Methylomusa anaerophila]|uniref:Metalloprotease LoiP n=1 Tax=Methylomusa anaerophila TaxID=1930071 RepID=A0A348AFN6_9FIRM|nr:M48 family metalloprotease [Methylomusa anaerophila]BBB89884.1 metalloprotease LoiP precursor [Methylomusa anaerophila]HML89070.1 M48 family metalloprotease [Methylomusa anaerophila]